MFNIEQFIHEQFVYEQFFTQTVHGIKTERRTLIMTREREVGHEVRVTDYSIKRAVTACLKALGIDEVTAMHGYILGYLSCNSDKDIFQKDIEEHFSVGRSGVTSILTLMEKNGYVTRCSVERDARLKKIVITEKGICASNDIRNTIQKLEQNMKKGISDEEMEVFYSVIQRIRDNASEIRAEAEKNPNRKGNDNND